MLFLPVLKARNQTHCIQSVKICSYLSNYPIILILIEPYYAWGFGSTMMLCCCGFFCRGGGGGGHFAPPPTSPPMIIKIIFFVVVL